MRLMSREELIKTHFQTVNIVLGWILVERNLEWQVMQQHPQKGHQEKPSQIPLPDWFSMQYRPVSMWNEEILTGVNNLVSM